MPISLGMSNSSKTVHAPRSDDDQLRRVLDALGIDPATLVWPAERAATPPRDPVHSPVVSIASASLSEEEWRALSPHLPAEAPQARSMHNRAFLESVLAAMQRGGAWTSPTTPSATIEAVRRRFGRWAHLGAFETLAAALPALPLTPEVKRQLSLACRRAAGLRARVAGKK
jgi:transposase